METFEVKTEDLVLDPANSRKHKAADVEATAASLREFGQQTPIVLAAESNKVVKGNGTTMAARYLLEEQDKASERLDAGMPEEGDAALLEQDWSVLVCVRTSLEGEAEAAYALADNKTGTLAPFDKGNIGDMFSRWEAAGTLNRYAIGWNNSEIGRFTGTKQDDPGDKMDKADVLLEKWGVEPGDRFCLKGRHGLVHRLACGDVLDGESLEWVMNGRKADLYCADPPYNVNYTGTALGDRDEIANDNLGEDFGVWLHSVLSVVSMHLGDGRSFYIWYANSESRHVFNALEKADLRVRQCLIWKKNAPVIGRQDYQWMHEPCVFGAWSDPVAMRSIEFPAVVPQVSHLATSPAGYGESFEPVAYGWAAGTHRWFGDRKQRTVLEYDRPRRSDSHPTMKPVPLIQNLIRNSTKSGEIVLDTFLGSGTTMYASEVSQRVCAGIELMPKYCAVILERMVDAGCKVEKQ